MNSQRASDLPVMLVMADVGKRSKHGQGLVGPGKSQRLLRRAHRVAKAAYDGDQDVEVDRVEIHIEPFGDMSR